MSERQRDDEGDFDEEYSTAEILRVVREDGPLGTGAVAEKVGCHRNTARGRLKQLAEAGDVERIQTGTDKRPAFTWRVVD